MVVYSQLQLIIYYISHEANNALHLGSNDIKVTRSQSIDHGKQNVNNFFVI